MTPAITLLTKKRIAHKVLKYEHEGDAMRAAQNVPKIQHRKRGAHSDHREDKLRGGNPIFPEVPSEHHGRRREKGMDTKRNGHLAVELIS